MGKKGDQGRYLPLESVRKEVWFSWEILPIFFRKKTIDPDHSDRYRILTLARLWRRRQPYWSTWNKLPHGFFYHYSIAKADVSIGCIQIIFDCIRSLPGVNHCSQVFSSWARWSQPKRVPKKVSSQFTSSYAFGNLFSSRNRFCVGHFLYQTYEAIEKIVEWTDVRYTRCSI